MTKRPMKLTHRVDRGKEVDRRRINQLVNKHIQNRFQQTLELIDIRYQELDRVTAHGLAPLPVESELHDLLRKKTPDEDQ